MAKGNDKKVVREAHALLLTSISNLLESHRERTFRKKRKAKSRAEFCGNCGLNQSNVAHIETGRFLGLTFPQLRSYLAAAYGTNDAAIATSAKKVYDGLKELPKLLKRL